MLKVILTGLLFAYSAAVAAAASTHPLFIIERSKNANVVHYDAQLDGNGRLDPKEPVIVYWIMLAEDGRREELNWLERHKAYGFSIHQDRGGQFYRMTLMAYEEREVKVFQDGEKVRAEIAIDTRPSYLERIYIDSTEGTLIPKVNYIELFGQDVKSGEKRYEKILPK